MKTEIFRLKSILLGSKTGVILPSPQTLLILFSPTHQAEGLQPQFATHPFFFCCWQLRLFRKRSPRTIGMTLLSYLADPEGSDSFRHHRLMCWSDYSQQEKHPTDPSDQAHQLCKNPTTGIVITSTLQPKVTQNWGACRL